MMEWLMALVAVVVAVLGWVWWMRRRQAVPTTSLMASQNKSTLQGHDVLSGGYNPHNVGNDASARPWERNTTNFQSSRYSDVINPSPDGLMGMNTPVNVPAGFNADDFLRSSKANFINLQAAWDRADIPTLKAMMTDTMLAQIKSQLADRERQQPGITNVTEVVMLDARLLSIENLEREYIASVEFSGLIREETSAGPNPFREVWNITHAKSGPANWLVAGVQALQ